MFKLEPIQDLLTNRKEVYNHIPAYARSGMFAEILSNDLGYALQVVSNDPTFQISLDSFKAVDCDTEDLDSRWNLPFENFSFIINISSTVRIVTVISRVEAPKYASDTIMVQSFSKDSSGQNKWEFYIPMRLNLVKEGESFVMTRSLAARNELSFQEGYNLQVHKAHKEAKLKAPYANHYINNIETHLAIFFNILSILKSSPSILFKPASTESLSVHRASTLPKDFWEYTTVKLGTKSSPVPYKGGHHASPRQHTRRGHYRTYASGKCVFIEAMVVGDINKGMIVKDYEMEKEA